MPALQSAPSQQACARGLRWCPLHLVFKVVIASTIDDIKDSRAEAKLTVTEFVWALLDEPSAMARAELCSLKPKTRGTYCSGCRWGRMDGYVISSKCGNVVPKKAPSTFP